MIYLYSFGNVSGVIIQINSKDADTQNVVK